MVFWNKICGFITVFVIISFSGSAQILSGTAYYNKKQIEETLIVDSTFALNKVNFQRIAAISSIIPQNYYSQHLGFICKKEIAFEKVTKVPFRFRLGSLQQCNYLEGKR